MCQLLVVQASFLQEWIWVHTRSCLILSHSGECCLLWLGVAFQSLKLVSFTSPTAWHFWLERLGSEPGAFGMQRRWSVGEAQSLPGFRARVNRSIIKEGHRKLEETWQCLTHTMDYVTSVRDLACILRDRLGFLSHSSWASLVLFSSLPFQLTAHNFCLQLLYQIFHYLPILCKSPLFPSTVSLDFPQNRTSELSSTCFKYPAFQILLY